MTTAPSLLTTKQVADLLDLTVQRRTTMYQIESLTRYGIWTDEEITDDPAANTFETAEEAEAMIAELRTIGDEWATAQYRVVEIAR
jgi:hypothetical protein